MSTERIEDLLRRLAPQVLGALVRRFGHFDTAEDAVQEALLAASQQWQDGSGTDAGRPDDPKAWLIAVAARRLTDLLRSEQARQRREETVARWVLPEQWLAPPADRTRGDADDTLILLFLCCHPSLSPASQIALTLRAVGGLTTAEIARAFLVPEATMTRRISRAKQTIKASGIGFAAPPTEQREQRLAALLHVLYLIFNEGYAATSGPRLHRPDLTAEAIRLTRLVHAMLPDDGEVAGLLALMLLTDARRPARTDHNGELVPMAEQDRTLWNVAFIKEGVDLITATLSGSSRSSLRDRERTGPSSRPRGPVGPYQLQAAIAAVHDEAPTAEETDWPQIEALYRELLARSDNPMVALNHAVALAMARGPRAGLTRLEALAADARIADDHRLFAVRAHLLELAGDRSDARRCYLEAAARTTSLPQQRYLHSRAARIADDS